MRGIYQKENIYSQKKSAYYNYIFRAARGKYFAFCECDDYWISQEKLQIQVDFLEENREYIACTHECLEVNQIGEVVSQHYTNGCYLRYLDVYKRQVLGSHFHENKYSIYSSNREDFGLLQGWKIHSWQVLRGGV